MRCLPIGLAVLGVLAPIAAPRSVAAQTRAPWRVRAAAHAATMVSRDQQDFLRYDQAGLLGSVDASWFLTRHLEILGGVTVGTFLREFESDGGLFATFAGVRASTDSETTSLFAELDLGTAWTGELVRPYLGLKGGVEVAASSHVALGPFVQYGQVFESDDARFTDDARFVSAGLSVSWRSATEAPPPRPARPRVVTRTQTVIVREPTPPSAELLSLLDEAVGAATDRVELIAPVLFEFDSDALQPIGVAMLHEVATTLRERTDLELVEIQGYTDARGDPAHNATLAMRRAEVVRAWLVAHGIDAPRLVVAARAGEFVETTPDEAAHQQNRRVIFRVLRARDR